MPELFLHDFTPFRNFVCLCKVYTCDKWTYGRVNLQRIFGWVVHLIIWEMLGFSNTILWSSHHWMWGLGILWGWWKNFYLWMIGVTRYLILVIGWWLYNRKARINWKVIRFIWKFISSVNNDGTSKRIGTRFCRTNKVDSWEGYGLRVTTYEDFFVCEPKAVAASLTEDGTQS